MPCLHCGATSSYFCNAGGNANGFSCANYQEMPKEKAAPKRSGGSFWDFSPPSPPPATTNWWDSLTSSSPDPEPQPKPQNVAPASAPAGNSGGGHSAGGSISTILTWATIAGIGLAILGSNDKDAPQKAPETTAQPQLNPGQTLEQSFATVSRISPQNLRFIAVENTELSIPFIRDQKIYEYAVTVEKGSCLLKAGNDYQTYTNAILGVIANNSPIQTGTVTVMGLINPTHSLVQQDASDFSPEDCNVRLLSAPPSTMAFPTEPEIQAMIQLGMTGDQYYTATEDLEIYRKNSNDSEMEYRFAKGSCLRVMGRTDTFQYVAAYTGNSLTGALIYDGYADPSKLQRKIFAKDSTELCRASLTSATPAPAAP